LALDDTVLTELTLYSFCINNNKHVYKKLIGWGFDTNGYFVMNFVINSLAFKEFPVEHAAAGRTASPAKGWARSRTGSS
jgi:hypothetical protein